MDPHTKVTTPVHLKEMWDDLVHKYNQYLNRRVQSRVESFIQYADNITIEEFFESMEEMVNSSMITQAEIEKCENIIETICRLIIVELNRERSTASTVRANNQ